MAEVPPLQSNLVHAALYASLTLQVSQQLFPASTFFALSEDQRRIVNNETQTLLLRSRWNVESTSFADTFAIPQATVPTAPEGTVLGRPAPSTGSGGGHYV